MDAEWAKLVPEFDVTDLKKSLDFYVGKLGFIVKYGREEDNFVYLDKEGSQIMLEQIDTKDRHWLTGDLEKPFGRGINFQIEIADAVSLYNNLKRENFQMFDELEEKWYRVAEDLLVGQTQFLVQDPDGYLLRFCSNLGVKPIEG